MTDFVLVHGGFHGGWCWERTAPLLEARGHVVAAPDLPIDDPEAGLDDYAEVVAAAAEGLAEPVVVGHSLGSLVLPRLPARAPVAALVYLCSVPLVAGGATGRSSGDERVQQLVTPTFLAAERFHDAAGRELLSPASARAVFYADLDGPDADWALARLRPESPRPLAEPGQPLPAGVPIHVVLADDDQVLPFTATREHVARATGRDPLVVPGGHSPFLSCPAALVEALEVAAARARPVG